MRLRVISDAPTVYLSRRNLLTLLSKLDRVVDGEDSTCAIIKNDQLHPVFPSQPTLLIAVEDEEYYTEREPGPTKELLP